MLISYRLVVNLDRKKLCELGRDNVIGLVVVRLLMAWATKSATTGIGSEQPNMYLR